MVRMLPCKLNNSCPLFNLFDLDYSNLLCALDLFLKKKEKPQHNNKDFGSLFSLPCYSGLELWGLDSALCFCSCAGRGRSTALERHFLRKELLQVCAVAVCFSQGLSLGVWFAPFFPGAPFEEELVAIFGKPHCKQTQRSRSTPSILSIGSFS